MIYAFSVVHAQFNQLYEQAIDRSDKANMPSKRIHNIIEYMTYEIYLYIQRGLFERHKIIFALMLTNKVLCSAGKIKVRAPKSAPNASMTAGARHPPVGALVLGLAYMKLLCSASKIKRPH
eukprot:1158208-Pelagomonas_calceolata.AAC.9